MTYSEIIHKELGETTDKKCYGILISSNDCKHKKTKDFVNHFKNRMTHETPESIELTIPKTELTVYWADDADEDGNKFASVAYN